MGLHDVIPIVSDHTPHVTFTGCVQMINALGNTKDVSNLFPFNSPPFSEFVSILAFFAIIIGLISNLIKRPFDQNIACWYQI